MSNSNIMSVKEMIDATFGGDEMNVVNFKLMQAILYILARQLRILERRVEIELIRGLKITPSTSLTISEIKLQAIRKKTTNGLDATTASDKVTSKKSNSEKTLTASGKTTSSKTPTSTDKTTSSKTPTASDQTTSIKTPTMSDKTTSSKTPTASDQTTSIKTPTMSDKTTSSKTPTASDQTTSIKTPTMSDNTTSSKTPTASDQTTSIKTPTMSDKTTSIKTPTSTDKTTTKSSSSDKARKDKVLCMDDIEEVREKELRVIHQRADSREEGQISPTPMASISEVEMEYEKLLIVESVPAERVTGYNERIPRLSIVTKDQFTELKNMVKRLEQKFATVGQADFPDNAQLMNDLRRGASLTDAMAALQLSARLEAAEKALTQMTSIVTDLVSKLPKGQGAQTKTKTEVLFDGSDKQAKKSGSAKKTGQGQEDIAEKPSALTSVSKKDGPKPDCITYEQLETALKELYAEFVKTVSEATKKCSANADNAMKLTNKIESQMETAKILQNKMVELERAVASYTNQINVLDTGLTSQITNYQEELTQMQHDLETGLETMNEALANTGGDTTAVADLNNQFSILQTDIDNSNISQKELQSKQNVFSLDLKALWKQIEILRETKADRDEVVDALKDKAGIGDLNGLVSLQQFHAVRGDIEKNIKSAYDKFNNQESVWQKVIDELFRELHQKAAWIQFDLLREDVNTNLEKLRKKLKEMLDIVGEPKAAALTRQIHRDANCLSCSTAAHMDLTSERIPLLPEFHTSRPQTVGAESTNVPREDGDHGVCYPGRALSHPIDPRSHTCQRYCGGSHTNMNSKINRVPQSMILTRINRQYNTGIGTDGKAYKVDEDSAKPCLPCNSPRRTAAPAPSISECVDFPEKVISLGSDMTPEDFRISTAMAPMDMLSNTPPPPNS